METIRPNYTVDPKTLVIGDRVIHRSPALGDGYERRVVLGYDAQKDIILVSTTKDTGFSSAACILITNVWDAEGSHWERQESGAWECTTEPGIRPATDLGELDRDHGPIVEALPDARGQYQSALVIEDTTGRRWEGRGFLRKIVWECVDDERLSQYPLDNVFHLYGPLRSVVPEVPEETGVPRGDREWARRDLRKMLSDGRELVYVTRRNILWLSKALRDGDTVTVEMGRSEGDVTLTGHVEGAETPSGPRVYLANIRASQVKSVTVHKLVPGEPEWAQADAVVIRGIVYHRTPAGGWTRSQGSIIRDAASLLRPYPEDAVVTPLPDGLARELRRTVGLGEL